MASACRNAEQAEALFTEKDPRDQATEDTTKHQNLLEETQHSFIPSLIHTSNIYWVPYVTGTFADTNKAAKTGTDKTPALMESTSF